MTHLITATEVAERLAVDTSTVYEWARAGAIPAFRMGRLVRFDPDIIDDWVEDRIGQRQGSIPGPSPQERNDVPRVDRLRAAVMARIPVPPA